jgi:hypothetical protein
MVILFSWDSCDFLFMSQFIFLILGSNCLLLDFICVCHVSFLSRWSPKYLTSCLIGMGKLLILACGQTVLLVVNVIYVDFAGLTKFKNKATYCRRKNKQTNKLCFHCFTPSNCPPLGYRLLSSFQIKTCTLRNSVGCSQYEINSLYPVIYSTQCLLVWKDRI